MGQSRFEGPVTQAIGRRVAVSAGRIAVDRLKAGYPRWSSSFARKAALLRRAHPDPGGTTRLCELLSSVLRSRLYVHGVDEFVIAFRTRDERGRAIVDALEDLADITLRQVLEARRYGLTRGGVGSIEVELERIDPSWRDHLRVYREAIPEPH